MVAGALGLVLSLLFWSSFSPTAEAAPWWMETPSWRNDASSATSPSGSVTSHNSPRKGRGGR
jgi:hypothetical protein